eukprot:scaffold264494_cov27-Tisochrysis_lutea.AAC.7
MFRALLAGCAASDYEEGSGCLRKDAGAQSAESQAKVVTPQNDIFASCMTGDHKMHEPVHLSAQTTPEVKLHLQSCPVRQSMKCT